MSKKTRFNWHVICKLAATVCCTITFSASEAVAQKHGDIISLKSLGNIEGPRWLDGRTYNGTVGLAPQNGKSHSGTMWQVNDLGGGAFALKCLGDIEGPRWLDGNTANGTIGLLNQSGNAITGTKWQFVKAENGKVYLKCLGDIAGPRWLDGRTGDGTVGLAPRNGGSFTGTKWEVESDSIRNPTDAQMREWRAKGPCSDPWISIAIETHRNAGFRPPIGAGDYGECNAAQYGGSWYNFKELMNAVYAVRDNLNSSKLAWEEYKLPGSEKAIVLVDSNGKAADARIISHNGAVFTSNLEAVIAKMVAAGAGNMVAAGAGNFAATLRAHNIVSPTGGNMVAAGAGNLKDVLSSFAGNSMRIIAAVPGRYRLQAADEKKMFKIGSSYYVFK